MIGGVVVLLVALCVIVAFGALRGAPYLPILKADIAGFWGLAELRPGDTLIDLGSGDGRLLRAAAQRGIRGIGYEINPLLYIISLLVCWRYRHLITIHLGDFWTLRLPQVDVIYVFLIGRYMAKLEAKLTDELTTPTVVISHAFELPGREPTRTVGASFRYDLP